MAPSLEPTASRPPSGVASPPQRISRSRTQSISSDRPSTIAYSFMSPPLSVSPEAAFIAASAASQIVTNDHDSHADAWYDQHGVEPSGETAMVSNAALQLVNNFLDQLLFNFLSIARSTSLSALRPAVSEVLKPKLAKDAINQADEELREYLGGDDEDLQATSSPSSPSDWDLELAWKRTRLRCMVYSSLGDMEEEDEDFYMESEHLETGAGDRPSEVVSPAVAIFLTSILEFMGEQALVVAGQASYHRLRVKFEKELKDGARSPADIADRVVVEELDMERVALDRTLGRLWRAWKKKIRSPGITTMDQRLSRSFSKDSMRGASGHLRSPSSVLAEPTVPETVPEPANEVESGLDEHKEDEVVQEPLEEHLFAAGIPLPIGDYDVDEIEVPGLACYSDDETEEDEDEELLPARPKSLVIFSAAGAFGLPTPTQSQPQTPIITSRKRSNSLPTPAAIPYSSKRQRLGDSEATFADPQSEDGQVPDGVSPEELSKDDQIADSEVQSPISYDTEVGSDVEEVATPPPRTVVQEATPVAARKSFDATHAEEEVEDEDDEVVIEEPQILMSSRVSISGRSISPAASEHGRPAAINTGLPVRTPSIHSARLIDVSNPRSPVLGGSRRSSADVTENIRQTTLSRNSGGRTPPIGEERMRRSPDSMSAFRSPAAIKSALSSSHSISEAEEIAGIDEAASPTSPTSTHSGAGTSLAVIPEPVSADPYNVNNQPIVPGAQSVFGSVARRNQAPPSPVRPVTKVTILSSTSSGTFFHEDKPESPRRGSAQSRSQDSPPRSVPSSVPPPPSVPERNAGRHATPPQTQPSTIGQVSVERVRTRSPSEPFPRNSESGGMATRQQHTSGSNSSTSTTRLKPVRTSEETTHSRDRDVARNFEELIQSDETIQYTLTPEGMRDMDSQSSRSITTGSPIIPVKTRKSEDARQNGERSRSSSVARPSDVKRSVSVTRSTSYPVPDGHRNNSITGSQTTPVARVTASASAKSRASPPQARDARLPRGESLAEFADFIRSTGPNGGSVAPASALRNAAGPIPISKSGIETGRASTAVSTGSVSRARLQAREAAVNSKDDNSDLIDFIRRGPPSNAGNPRIPRTVAPFRTTMDSDQLAAAVGGKAVDAQLRDFEVRSSQASTNAAENSMHSVPSSINSQSALLGRNKPLPGGNSRFGGMGDDDMPMPKRKTRRVRDPYAIDISDEEDEDEEDAAPKPQRRQQTQEESLMDFLRNVPPPAEPVIQPFVNTQAQNRPKKKASAPSLMARFTRRDSSQTGGNSSGSSSPRSPVTPMPTIAAAETRSTASRSGGGRGYTPIQVNIPPGADKYGVSSSYSNGPSAAYSKASAMMGDGPPPVNRRVPMKKFEPRDAVSVPARGTSELADFFKNSEPPPNLVSQYSPPPVGREDNKGFFTRRKKTSAA
ncbi:hypothetical protein B0T25DRAFT_127289 [Lasiosphaeria hispida]|uniref:Uncharacterized protein n=1 Tax=Lasiosphaeria hispida TaxID=260671 RepID=A0AAJ0HRX5_9PEZI|nr:hypothetical protein B0T25DRAFT_127289 [Lasiosphaeria hispida]